MILLLNLQEAQEAETHDELWNLFFTPEMLDSLVVNTNAKIAEDFEASTCSSFGKKFF